MAINFKGIADRLQADSLRYLKEWLPGGKQHGREYVCGNLRGDAGESLSVNVDTCIWKDFASGVGGGDLISLYAAIRGIKQGEAAKELSNGREELPDDTHLPGINADQIPAHTKYGTYSYVAEYRYEDGKLCGYICRFDPANDSKQHIPRTFWRKHDGTGIWKWKKWPGLSPIYRLPELVARPDAKVLIVEGEKKADHAQKLLPDWVVVGWCGGAEAVKGTNWEHLKSRYCWIWPDNDEVGRAAARTLKKILPQLHIVDVPKEAAEHWDLGDANPEFPVIDFLIEGEELVVKTSTPALSTDAKALILTHLDPQNATKALATIDNTRDLLNYYGITCRYNVVSKRIEANIPGESFSVENREEAELAVIYSRMKEWKIPTDGYGMYLIRIADENQYNPVVDWVRSRAWDGKSRLPQFYDTITSPEYEAKELLLRRWLITAMSMALNNGIDSAGCLVLQGPPNLGKTWWTKKLVPEQFRNSLVRTDASVDPKDKDSVSQIISYWICELGEIGATFNRADLQAIKTFITRDHDTMRRPYGIGDKHYPRRTALIASVDQHIFLHDTAGNRRFWTIPCTAINSYHDIDMQQVWAEVLNLIEQDGETWRLQADELEHINRINKQHTSIEPLEEMIMVKYDFEMSEYLSGEGYTATQIAEYIGLKNITKSDTNKISDFLRKMGFEPKKDRRGNRIFKISKSV